MKPIDDKDKPKLFAMIGLCVLVLGFGVYQFMGASAPSSTPASAATPKAADAKPAAAKPTEQAFPGADPASTSALDAALAGPPTGGRDPFMPSGIAAPRKAPIVVPSVAAQPNPTRTPVPIGGLNALLDNAARTLPLGGHQGLPTSGGASVVVMPPAPPPALSVTGVVMGDAGRRDEQNVAIVRAGEKGEAERRFVTVGDAIGNGYKVVAVHSDGVDIEDRSGRRRLTVRIGKVGEDSRASK